MKRAFPLLLCLLTPLLHFAQRAVEPESIALATYQKINALPAGSDKVDRLNALTQELLRNNPPLAITYAEEALSLAEDIDYPLGIAEACLTLGSLDTDHGHTEMAVDYVSKALQLSVTHDFRKQKADAYRILGNIFLAEGDLSSAEVNYLHSLKVAREMGDSINVSKIFNNLGMIKTKEKNYIEAIKYFTTAVDVMRISGNNQLTGLMYNNIGTTYTLLGDYRKADLFLDRAEKVYQSFTDLRGQAYVFQSRAENLLAEGQYLPASQYMERAIAVFEQFKVPADICDARVVYARLLTRAKQPDQALQQLEMTLELGIQSGEADLSARACYEMAQMLAATQPAKADEAYKKGIRHAESAETPDWQMQLNRAYADFLLQQKRPAEAVACLEKCMALIEAHRLPWREWFEVYDTAAKTYTRLQNEDKAATTRKKYDEYLAMKTTKKP